MIKKLDHIAIAVRDTEEALKFYRDQLGLSVVLSEEMEDSKVRLTHLDMGNVQLQLVQPLVEGHPLHQHLDQQGEGLHHLCFWSDDLNKTTSQIQEKDLKLRNENFHSAPLGKRAGFIDPTTARGVLWEFTGPNPAASDQ